jgi:hypothetical protein
LNSISYCALFLFWTTSSEDCWLLFPDRGVVLHDDVVRNKESGMVSSWFRTETNETHSVLCTKGYSVAVRKSFKFITVLKIVFAFTFKTEKLEGR